MPEWRIVDCGNGMNPDIEKIIDLRPDAIMLSPFENSGGYGRVGKLGVPVIECADYMETSPLGRAEWLRFYGLLVGQEQREIHFCTDRKRIPGIKGFGGTGNLSSYGIK